MKESPSNPNNTQIFLDGRTTPEVISKLSPDAAGGYDLSNYYIYGGSSTESVQSTSITMLGGKVYNIYGGGLEKSVISDTKITVSGGEIRGDIYGGGCISGGSVGGNTYVVITKNANVSNGSVFGGGYLAGVTGSTNVTISGGAIKQSVYGGGDHSGVVAGDANVTITGGTIGYLVFGGGESIGVNGRALIKIGVDANLNFASVCADTHGGGKVNSHSIQFEVAFYDGTTKLTTPDSMWVEMGLAYNFRPTSGTVTEPTTIPTNPVKIFNSWQTADGSAFKFPSNITAPTKLYSNWTYLPTVQITAQPQEKSTTYGYTVADAPTLSVTAEKTEIATGDISYQWYQVKSGNETNDTKVGTNSNTLTIPTGLDAGTHSFYCVVSCDGYNEVSASVSLTVGKKALTVKANDQLNIIKGAAMPELTFALPELVNGDTFTNPVITTTATDTNTVGEYAILISGGTLTNADSYTVSYEGGKLTVVNATYTVTVTNGTGGGSYSEGQIVTITANNHDGDTFTGWSSSDGVTFASNTASTTTFTMPGRAVTVTANYSKNSSSDGGGSSGGGSSSSGRSSTTTPEKKPNQPITATAPVTATAGKNGTASASIPDKTVTDAIAKAQSDATSQGKTANGISVELNVTMPKGATSLTAALTRSSLDSLVSAGVNSLEINGSLVQVSFDKKALSEIQKQSTGNISITIAPKTNLSDAAKKIIGTRRVYDITVGYGSGKSVSSFGGGIATVSIPYTLGKNEAVGGLYAVYVDAKGNATRIAGSAYDTNSGCVIFTTTHFSQYGIGYTAPTAKFTDISTHWANESIDYVVGRGLLSGTSDTAFSPNSAMTRGMLVTALGRLAGVDVKAYTTGSFTDVKLGSTFQPYIEWAYKKGIIQGIGNSQFAPDRAITREEIAVIFANYAKATGYTLPITREVTTYADAASIGSTYKDAVKAMQQAGIMMGGNNNNLNPGSSATRAEVAAMLTRYIKLTINPATAQGWAQNDAGQYLYYKDGKALTGTQTIDGVKYFFNTDGMLKTGWVQDGDNWRFYSGKTMLVGWWDLGANGSNKTYYFTKDGLMVSGKWLEIDGKWYYFYTDGSLARSTKIDGYEVDKNGLRKIK